jgi:D-aspartate ligase
MQAKTPVVILNMHYTGLGVARNLAGTGVPVFGLSSLRGFPGNRTRHCTFVESPDSLTARPELLRFLLEFARRFETRPILFPTRDHDITFLMENRPALEAKYVLPFASNPVMDAALNKDLLVDIARECGVPFPGNFTVRGPEDLPALRGGLVFPAIAKPVYARDWRKPGIWEAVGSQKVVRLASYAELEAFYAKVSPFEKTLIVQEWIPGGDANLVIFGSYCGRDSEVKASFTGRKRVQYPPESGTGVVVEGYDVPEVVEPCRALLRKIGFFGISEIEFKRHEATGRHYLIEINPRHWDQHRLGTAMGVNLTLALYRDLTGQPALPMSASKRTVRWIAEKDYLLELARGALKGGHYKPGALLSLLSGKRVYPIVDLGDPAPAFHLLGEIARDGARWLFPRRGRG